MPPSVLIPGAQALVKGIQVLKTIPQDPAGARFSDIQAQTSFPKPTLHRILKALMAEGLVRHDAQAGRYHLGMTLLRLAFQVLEQMDVRGAAREDMLGLSEQTGEAVHLAVLDGTEAVYIDLVESHHPIGHIGRLGSTAALHAAASGKVIAAHLDEAVLARLLRELKLPRLTSKTITSVQALQQQLALIRQQGYAVNQEEEAEGVCGVAAPVFDLTGAVIGSLGISIPSYRYHDAQLATYAQAAVQAAQRISARLGYARNFHHTRQNPQMPAAQGGGSDLP